MFLSSSFRSSSEGNGFPLSGLGNSHLMDEDFLSLVRASARCYTDTRKGGASRRSRPCEIVLEGSKRIMNLALWSFDLQGKLTKNMIFSMTRYRDYQLRWSSKYLPNEIKITMWVCFQSPVDHVHVKFLFQIVLYPIGQKTSFACSMWLKCNVLNPCGSCFHKDMYKNNGSFKFPGLSQDITTVCMAFAFVAQLPTSLRAKYCTLANAVSWTVWHVRPDIVERTKWSDTE